MLLADASVVVEAVLSKNAPALMILVSLADIMLMLEEEELSDSAPALMMRVSAADMMLSVSALSASA